MEKMIRVLFFFIVFTFSLSSKAFYEFTERELKETWRDSGFNSVFFRIRIKQQCYTHSINTQEIAFSSCMMVLHHLVSNITKDKPMQVRVSPSNNLEIVPYPEGQTPETPGDESWNKRKESFIAFFQSQVKENEQHTSIEGFNDILEQSLDLLGENISSDDQAYYLGMSYSQYFIENNNDPYSMIYPQSLSRESDNSEYIGIGVNLAPYKTKYENLNGIPVINPFKGSPAEAAGLRKGDLLLAVNGESVKEKPLSEIRDQIQPLEGDSVKLTVQSFCKGETNDITITSKKGAHSFDITEESYFINIEQPEPLNCNHQPPPADEKSLQALYVPLKTLLSPKKKISSEQSSVDFSVDTLHFCDKFIQLQKKDLQNPKSLGMIIDLRGNQGGRLREVACMLNTIISDTDLMIKKIPLEFGKITDNGPSTYYFTDAGPIMDIKEGIPHTSLPSSYNKNIVVLVDEISMSGSELFAGIFQDKKRGWVIGDRTVGKGSAYSMSYIALGNKLTKPVLLRETTAIYTFNSGRTIQDVGVIPDFRFSNTGEPIEDDDSSMKDRHYFKHFNLDTQWEQSRPDKVASLTACANQDHKVSATFKRKIQQKEKYNRPFVADYQLELAKDILTCSPPVESYIVHSESYSIFEEPYKKIIE